MTLQRRMVILAEAKFGPLTSKTANQAIRYIPESVVGIIDSLQAEKKVQEVLGFGGDIPVFGTLEESLVKRPDTLLIGIAPTGGRLPESWRPIVIDALDNNLNVISGLHTYLSDDPEFRSRAHSAGVELIDLRKVPPKYEVVVKGLWKKRRAKTILTVGTDCNVGKMTASYELNREFLRRGMNSAFLATGQTGILLSGSGVCVDSVVGDYIAGSIETAIDEVAGGGAEYIHVEGQGSLTHQGYSSVTLGMLHGVMPDAMIMVHHPIRPKDDYGQQLDNLPTFIHLHEMMLSPFRQSKVVGIAINTVNMNNSEIEEAKIRLEQQTGLPVGNVFSPDVRVLADAIVRYCRDNLRETP
jgi:D-glutamate N-acetyltransferase